MDNRDRRVRSLSIAAFVVLGILIVIFFLRYNRHYEYDEYFQHDATATAPLAQNDVDFKKLKENNSDAVGWIYFENCDISYPIMQGDDNSEYVHKNIYGTGSKNGSIFLDADNASDFSDAYNVIFGNNMHDDTMFGLLDSYFNEDGFLESNLMVQVLTEDGNYRFQVFAISIQPKDSSIISAKASRKSEVADIVSTIKGDSLKKISTDEYADFNKILSLVTHDADGNYYVVSLVKVDYAE